MSRFAYRVALEPALEGGFVVTFPDFGWGVTQGDTETLALANAEDALDEMVATMIAGGEDLPMPGAGPGPRVHLGAQMSAKAALYEAMRAAHLSQVELARRLSLHEKEVRRMLDPRHLTKLPRMDAAMRALGRRLVIEVEAA